jgi:hypothetical protein
MLQCIPNVQQVILYKGKHKDDLRSAIPIVNYEDEKESVEFVRNYMPDAIVVTKVSHTAITKFAVKNGIHIFFVGHGILDDKRAICKSSTNRGIWDIFCRVFVANKEYKDMIVKSKKIEEYKVIENVLPQLDLLYKERNKKRRDEILVSLHKIGHKLCTEYDKSLYKLLSNITTICKSRAWEFSVKGCSGNNINYAKKIIGSSDKINLLQSEQLIYPYLNSKAVITCGITTVQLESCLLGTSLGLLVSTKGDTGDLFGTESFGASLKIRTDSIKNTEKDIDTLLNSNMSIQQKNFCDDFGISFDGNHCKRMQDIIIQVIINKE